MTADRLSDLPDDLLRHILRFAPAREGASTAVLSSRWRSLWRTSGAVNLDSRSYDRAHGGRFSFAKRDDFVRGAEAALAAAAADAPVRRLTVHVEEGTHWDAFFQFMRADGSEHDTIGAVLSHAAARHVEELCIRAHRPGIDQFRTVFYDLNIGALWFLNFGST